MAFRIAAHLCGWPQDVVRDRRRVLEIVKGAGYDGVEGFSANSAEDLVELGALAAEYGLRLLNLGAPDSALKARFNATLGNDAAEVPAGRKPGHEPSDAELDSICQGLESHLVAFSHLGLKPFHHIHVGCILETTADCARVLKRLPGLWLLYDTGHLQAANCDPMEVLARYPQQIGHVHLKNFWTQDPQAGWDRHQPDFWRTSRFCDLEEGNCGFDVGACLAGLERAGYRGWISVEEDHPRRGIATVVRDNRQFLRRLGY
jgi:sugar phosphate isomerase/epimerase